MISGTKEGVENGASVLKENGAKRVMPLVVSGAFHSPLMKDAESAFAPFIKEAKIKKSDIQLVMNVLGGPTEEIQDHLIAQVTGSVRWEEGIRYMDGQGVELFLEIGCGKTLNGMNRKIGVNGKTESLEKVSDLKAFGETLCN